MAKIPHSWGAYARLQSRLSSTDCTATAAALEEALNVVLQPDFQSESITDADLQRLAESAARRDRHRSKLVRGVIADKASAAGAVTSAEPDDVAVDAGSRSLDDEVHARRELARLKLTLREPDWELLMGVAAGVSYEVLATEHAASVAALRTRVCRLRRSIEEVSS